MMDRFSQDQGQLNGRVDSGEALLRRLYQLEVTTPAEIAKRGVRIFRTSSRHKNFRIETPQGGWFVKRGDHRGGFGTIAHERKAYRLLTDLLGSNNAVRLPTVNAYDEDLDLLILDIVAGATDLSALAFGGEPLGLHPTRLGESLALLHNLDVEAAQRGGLPIHNGTTIFQLDAPASHQLEQFSRAQIELIKALQGHSKLLETLRRLADVWKKDTVIHFDIRLANLLAHETTLTVLDLEYIGIGDARWDVAGMLAGFLETWLVSAPLGDPDGFDKHLDRAVFDSDSARQAIQQAWTAYQTHTNRPRISIEDAARFTGARLIQSAYEHAAEISEPNARVASLATLGLEFLENPSRSARVRLGIEDPFKQTGG